MSLQYDTRTLIPQDGQLLYNHHAAAREAQRQTEDLLVLVRRVPPRPAIARDNTEPYNVALPSRKPFVSAEKSAAGVHLLQERPRTTRVGFY